MTRLPDLRVNDRALGFAIAGVLGLVMVGAYVAGEDSERTVSPPPLSAHESCLAASRQPGPSGFAPEVCEPLSQGWEDPAVLLYPEHMDPGGCGTTPRGVRWCPVDFTPDADGCLTFTYAMLHGEPQEKWGDPGDGEVFCAR